MRNALWNKNEFLKIQKTTPGIGRVLDVFGHQTLGEYFQSIVSAPSQPLQSRSDLIEAGKDYVRPLLGPDIASRLAGRLEKSPVLLTANHLGVDFHPFVFQGDLLFGWAAMDAQTTAADDENVLPVMSFGSVSLGNQVYTRGIILSRETISLTDSGPRPRSVRIGVLPAGLRRTAASFAPPFSASMVAAALASVNRLHEAEVIGPRERQTLARMLENDYLRPDILEKDSFGGQVALLNHALWPRVFSKDLKSDLPDLVTMEIEAIATRLVEKDLFDRDSLLYRVLFDQGLREAVLQNLEEVFGCWDRRRLNQTLNENPVGGPREKALSKSGTGFFWGVSRRGRLVRLTLISDQGKEYLAGRDEYGTVHQVDFTPDGLVQGLLEGRLLPGLFVTFLEVAFSRGFRCLGGFFQAEYLPLMRQGLAAALKQTGQRDWANKVEMVSTADYITGMVVVLAQYQDRMKPAGMVEVMSGDGIGKKDLSLIKALTVAEANLFGLVEIYRDFAVRKEDGESRMDLLGQDRMDQTAGKMIRIEL